jgi:peptidoglycan/xylan/chitin deacetylase (PgdA/CDA1 family)
MKCVASPGFGGPGDFFDYLRDSFDVLYAEGGERPKMLSVGLHCRVAGRPGRTAALARFLDHVQTHRDVWVCRRIDIARHWHARHPYEGT